MSILAVDPGLGTFGWAVVARTGAVIACGVLVSAPDPKLGKHTDRVQRARAQARTITDLVRLHRIRHIAAEQMSFAPRSSAAAKIGIGMSWGSVIGVATASDIELVAVPPKTWQRAIVPAAIGEKDAAAIDYALVFKALSEFVDMKATGLDRIAKGKRNHALDAIGIGVYAALRIVPRGSERATAHTEAA